MERKEMKRLAKGTVRRHWLLLVALCLAAALLGAEFSASLGLLRAPSADPEDGTELVANGEAGEDLYSILLDAYAQVRRSWTETEERFTSSVLGRERGVLAAVVNGFTSGRYTAMVISGIYAITRSEDAAAVVFILGSLLLAFLFWLFVRQVYIVALRRMVLEAEEYEEAPLNRLRFLWQDRRWLRVGPAMMRLQLYQTLWTFTIVGGVVKRYSYLLTPYILAEEPSLTGREAITLSRRLMAGHKWECFCWELSFLGWDLLGALTGGLTSLLFTAPYKAAFWGRYYSRLRRLGKGKSVPGAERLRDECLYQKAGEEVLRRTYADAMALKTVIPPDPIAADRGFRRFLAVNLGISLYPRAVEEEYDRAVTLAGRLAADEDQMEGRAYPARLCPAGAEERKRLLPVGNYMRHYSPTSLILMFFLFACAGWVWEVALGFIQGGGFVNRGVLHGPWLPIYGAGGVMILVLLARLRRRPAAEFCAAIVLCGAVEYFTSLYLELANGGLKWWDYSGYFLNLHGRICAEGLLVFGVAGLAVVYYVAPALDDLLRRLKPGVAVPLCAVLLAAFLADQVYSASHPNTGKGVTDITAGTYATEERL